MAPPPADPPAYLSPEQVVAAAVLELRRRDREGLLEFMPRITPTYQGLPTLPPRHLMPLVELFERSLREPVFGLISVPPQFGKSELVLHALAMRARRKPQQDNAYISYIARIAEDKSLKCRTYAERAGVVMGDKATASWWTTAAGGNFYATGIGGPLTSLPISGMLVVDDPFKNKEECDRLTERNRVENWMDDVAIPRCHPGTSILVIHTRWHTDDLIARLMKRKSVDGGQRFEVINLQALDEFTEEPLWPERRPKEWLLQTRIDVKDAWWPLYMGKPRPRGGELFKGISAGLYTHLPNRYRISKGVDIGYTAKRTADASCSMVMAESGGNIYLVDREYARKKVQDFVPQLQRQSVKWKGPYTFLCSSMEAKGVEMSGDTFKDVKLTIINASTDKWQRAQAFAAAWNGVIDEKTNEVLSPPRVFLPKDAPWLSEYLDEIAKFTGDDDPQDDQVDASINAFWDFKDLGLGSRIYVPKTNPLEAYRFGARGLG